MSVQVNSIHSALEQLNADWTWALTNSRRADDKRIKVTACRKSNPSESRVLILPEDLLRNMSMQQIAEKILYCLTAPPPEPEDETHVVAINDTRRQYQILRKVYQTNVADLRRIPGRKIEPIKGGVDTNFEDMMHQLFQPRLPAAL